MRDINVQALKLTKRAENNKINLVESFVDLGPVIPILSNAESQILFGRRGTGKTHVLSYLHDTIANQKECSVFLDMRLIGSTGGIYSDPTLTIYERATRLLSDTLGAIHDAIMEKVIEDEQVYDLSRLATCLDAFADAATEVVVEGVFEEEASAQLALDDKSGASVDAGLGASSTLKLAASKNQSSTATTANRQKMSGKARLRVHFGSLSQAAKRLIDQLPKKRLWVILDEWSEVPLDLQPYLADLLRRTLFPIPGVAVKIAAIAQRCNFRMSTENSGYVGLEIGADAAASINLDEYLVFDNEPQRARKFFEELLYRHMRSGADDGFDVLYPTAARLSSELFTQINAFDEYVRSAEGVPRDAINILSLAAQRADDIKISVPDVRAAAKNWYTRGKQNVLSSKPEAGALLNWIVDEVIQHRQAKAFLVPSELRDELVDFLYDARVLHILKEGISAQDIPGRRFNVFAIDYGCYVDLINTHKAPKGLFQTDDSEEFIDVPQTDYRSIRRAILNIDEFYKSQELTPLPQR